MVNKIRTTVYLDRDLVELAKLEAVSRKMALTGLVEKGLRRELGVVVKKKGLKLGVYKLGGGRFKREDAYE